MSTVWEGCWPLFLSDIFMDILVYNRFGVLMACLHAWIAIIPGFNINLKFPYINQLGITGIGLCKYGRMNCLFN